MNWKSALAFYVEIFVWVAVWGIVVHLGDEIAHTKQEIYLYYILIAVFGSLLLYFLITSNEEDEDDK